MGRFHVGVALLLGGGVVWYAAGDRSTSAAPARAYTLDERVRVEVRNAGGVRGMAREATRLLRSGGFDVVEFGNAQAFDAERASAVIDRVGKENLAAGVAAALGIPNVLSDPDPNLFVDVSVLLGSEWTPPHARGADGDDLERPWWDPRGWFGQ